MITIEIRATTMAIAGAMSAGTTTFPISPSILTPPPPTAPSMAPIMPPMSACEELDGRPCAHVIRFQAMAPIRPAKRDRLRDLVGVDDARGDRRRDFQRDQGAGEVGQRGERDCRAGGTAPGSRSS